jgi:hypothetical protein
VIVPLSFQWFILKNIYKNMNDVLSCCDIPFCDNDEQEVLFVVGNKKVDKIFNKDPSNCLFPKYELKEKTFL